MLTAEVIRKSHPEMDDANVLAFLRFAKAFDCMDADSYEEAKEKISASMESISDEMDHAPEEEHAAIMRQRYRNL